jgi:multidrug resistance efflux pump
MEPLPKIPTPPRLIWREIRHRAFPVLVFAAAVVAATVLWREQAGVPHLVGEVESVTSLVTTVEDGTLLELLVDRYEAVEKDQIIGQFRVSDPDSVRVELAAIAADLQVMHTRLAQDQQRILQDYEQLRLNWQRERVALATSRIELRFAESELARVSKLFAEKLVSEDQFDLAQNLADSRRAEVAERETLVSEMGASLKRLAPDDAGSFSAGFNDQINQAIAAQEELLQLASKTVTLRAPISGLVSAINYRPGARVRRGEAIAIITASRPERIVGYLRASGSEPPRPGDAVEVRSRANRRLVGFGRVLRVGHHYETVSTNIAAVSVGLAARGLPVLVSLPENLTLLPGELVDLALRAE